MWKWHVVFSDVYLRNYFSLDREGETWSAENRIENI